MGEEGGTTEMIEKCLYVEMAGPRHDLIHLDVLGSFLPMKVRKGWMRIRPGRKEETKRPKDTFIVGVRVRQPKISSSGGQRL